MLEMLEAIGVIILVELLANHASPSNTSKHPVNSTKFGGDFVLSKKVWSWMWSHIGDNSLNDQMFAIKSREKQISLVRLCVGQTISQWLPPRYNKCPFSFSQCVFKYEETNLQNLYSYFRTQDFKFTCHCW